MIVVNFDQRTGALHAVCWTKMRDHDHISWIWRMKNVYTCNGWNGQLPLARLNIVVPVCGWIRTFEMRIYDVDSVDVTMIV